MKNQEKDKSIDVQPTSKTVHSHRITHSMICSIPASSKNNIIVKNLLHERLAQTRKPKTDTREMSQSGTVQQSTIRVKKCQQKICTSTSKKTRWGNLPASDNVGSLTLHTTSDQDQDDNIISLRTELDQKIANAIQTRRDVSNLIQKRGKLCRDTNALWQP